MKIKIKTKLKYWKMVKQYQRLGENNWSREIITFGETFEDSMDNLFIEENEFLKWYWMEEKIIQIEKCRWITGLTGEPYFIISAQYKVFEYK